MRSPIHRLGRALGVSLLTCSALAACGGSSDDLGPTTSGSTDTGTTPGTHEAAHIDTAGRLVILEDQSKSVRVLDLDTDRVNASFTTTHVPSAIGASPARRHAVVLQNTGGRVEFIDGGIWQEDHGDHLHDYMQAPQLLTLAIDAPRPSHYQTHDTLGALFFDGLADSGRPATAQTFTDEGLVAGRTEAGVSLDIAVHGTAEPRGEHLLVSVRDAESTGTLPDLVAVYRREGTAYRPVQTLAARCPSLHGSHSGPKHSVFGCSDGVLVVTEEAGSFTATKLAAPTSLPEGARISTVIGHPARAGFVGLAAPGFVFDIDAEAGTVRSIAWAEGRTRRAHAFDAEGQHLMLLDEVGSLHVLDATADWALKASVPVVQSMPTASPFPAITAGGADDAYLSDPAAREVVAIDVAGARVARRIPVDFRPTGLTWLGLPPAAH